MLWQAPWQSQHPNVAQPRPLPGDRVLVSTGYGVGAALFRVVRAPSGSLSAEEVWRNASLKAKFANFVDRDGFVYGLDDGILVCLDIETGERRWKAGRYGHGQVMLVGNLLIVTAESGDVVLVEAVPSQHRELGRSPAIAGKTWNPPALAGPYLLARNDREAVCLELPLER
jgi:outer membrane protein assembly factor BamB